ncbi:MAG: DNA-processing protein DprA [Lacipirellulaceae bacterium]
MEFNDSDRAQILLALTRDVGPLTRARLLEAFATPERVLAASEADLQKVQGIGPKISRRIINARRDIDLDVQLGFVEREGLGVLLPPRNPEDDTDYPRMLREIPDPPGVLFTRGELLPGDAVAVGIVGTRRATHYGKQQAERLAGALARAGVTVVSGLARGIDTAAHGGALAAGGRTIAVLASGVLNIYPPENEGLAEEISQNGCVLSEAAPTMPPMSGMFPQRNRIISGLSLGVIVIEAAERSGALITARHAYEQNREVFAVPGQVTSRVSAGPHKLLRDGAKLVTCVDDVLEELGPLVEPAPREDGRVMRSPAELKLNEMEQRVLDKIDPAGSHIENVAIHCELPIHRVLATISVLETRHLVRKIGGNQIARI